MADDKKQFDRAMCFTFFGKWYETMLNYEELPDGDKMAYRLFKAIAEYSLYKIEPEFSEEFVHLRVMWPLLEEEIDASVGHRSIHFADENRKAKERYVIQLSIEHPELSSRAIAKMTKEVPGMKMEKTAVNDIQNKHMDEILKGRQARRESCENLRSVPVPADSSAPAPDFGSGHSSVHSSYPVHNHNSGQDKADSRDYSFAEKSEADITKEAEELEKQIRERFGDVENIDQQIKEVYSYYGADNPGMLKWYMQDLLQDLEESSGDKEESA